VEVVGEAATLEEAVDLIDRDKPDAIFLDIHLGRQRGFAVLEKVVRKPLVVITTSHPHYAIKGFEVDAVDYLLKPVMEETLARAVQRLQQRKQGAGDPGGPRLAPGDMQIFKEADGLHLVPVDQIQAILGERIYTRVLVADGRTFLHNRPLREWRQLLPERIFKTLDRSTIVNLREVLSLRADPESGGNRIHFRGGKHSIEAGEVATKALRDAT